MFSVWTAKAGAGATSVAIGLAARLERRSAVLLVDLGGDLPAAFGVSDPAVGLTDWLASERSDERALGRVEVALDDRLALLPLGRAGEWSAGREASLLHLLASDDRAVVIDVGCVEPDPFTALAALRRRAAALDAGSLLVLRSSYLALRRVRAIGLVPTGVVLVDESGRSLAPRDVASIVGAPVLARLDVDASITRVIDDGVSLRRLPRPFTRALGGVA